MVHVACGPSTGEHAPSESTDTSTADATTGDGSTTTSGDSSGADESTTTTISSGAIDESSSSTTSPCGCGFVRIPANEPSPDGYSFADLVAALPGADGPWVWTAVDGMPITTVETTLEVIDTALWADDGCGGVSPSCRGISGRVAVAITTADGLLAESFEGGIDGILGESAVLDVPSDSFRTFDGTLPAAMFVDANGDPIVIDNAGMSGSWTWDGDTPTGTFNVYTPLVNAPPIILGQTTE